MATVISMNESGFVNIETDGVTRTLLKNEADASNLEKAINKLRADLTALATIVDACVKVEGHSLRKDVRLQLSKLNDTTNYVQFSSDGADKGYITFTVSRNVG